jgi:serine/threonine protein kinase
MTRACFLVCLFLGRLLRSARYSRVRIVDRDGEREVRKRRVVFAPLLIGISHPALKLLDTGVRILPQREWEERERDIYRRLYSESIGIDADGTLVLPCLAGRTLAALLDDPRVDNSERKRIIALAVAALARFHRLGLTHGDAMAENVLIDLDAGVARWFDFETVHDPGRTMDWRRADDVRALLVTCLLRTSCERRDETVRLVLDAYADAGVARLLAAHFVSVLRRPLAFHLAQAGLSFECYTNLHAFARLAPDVTPATGRNT